MLPSFTSRPVAGPPVSGSASAVVGRALVGIPVAAHQAGRILAVALALLAGACGPSLPRVAGSSFHRDSVARWEHSLAGPRAGAGLPRSVDEIPAQPDHLAAPVVEIPVLVTDEQPYGLTLRDAELGQALLLLGEMAGLNLVLDGQFSEPVRLSLPGVRLQSAIETLVRTWGCTLDVQGDVIVVRREDPAARRSQVFVLQSASAADVASQVAALAGTDGMVVNPGRNVLMVTAPAARVRDVEAYLQAVDQPDRQVLIEARILEINRSDLLELGSALARNDIAIDDWTASFVTDLLNPAPAVLASAATDSGSMDVSLDMLRELVGLEILQRPRLVALHGRQATLDILSEVPYVQTTTTTDSSTSSIGSTSIEEVEFKHVGLELAITPTIQADGLVSLTVDQRVSVQTGTFNSVPIVDSRSLTTSFVVREGDTIMIGGIMKNSQLESESGVPLLMDIPWLGQLFRNDVRETASQELVILMTPRLVDPRSLGPEAVDHVTVELEALS